MPKCKIPGHLVSIRYLGKASLKRRCYGEIRTMGETRQMLERELLPEDTMCKGPEAKKSSGYLRRRRKFL